MKQLPRTVAFWLVVVTLVVSLVTGLGSLGGGANLVWGFVPARASGLVDIPGAFPLLLTPLSATFMHGGFNHLAFNLLMLGLCAVMVERVLGWRAMLIIYVVSAYVAMAAQWLADPAGTAPVIGASGAISGLIGAYALTFGRPRRLSASQPLNRAIHILWLAAAWTVVQMLIGWSAGQQGMYLATPAHVGGFLTGLALQRPLLLWRYRRA